MPAALDHLDARLVAALHLLPRGSFDDIGSVLGVDASTIGRRFGRLQEERLVRVVGQVDWAMFSATLPVHLFIDSGGTAPSAVLARLGEFREVQYLAQTSGTGSVFATVHASSERDTAELLDRVHDVPGIVSVRSLPVLAVEGRAAGWDPGLLTDEERRRCLDLAGDRWIQEGATTAPHLDPTERAVVAQLQQDARASAAGLGRSLGIPPSTAHRVVRRVLDNGWVRPRVEIEPALLGFGTPFVLRVRVVPGCAPQVVAALTARPQVRFTTRVTGACDIVCTGLVADRAELAPFLDRDLATLAGVRALETDVVLGERRRYWMDRDPAGGLGGFAPPPLL